MANIKLKAKILNDRYTEYVYESFDIQNKEETSVSIPMNLSDIKDFDWNIGVILGGSGSGKTTILKNIGTIKEVKFDEEKPLISNFDWLEPKEATLVLISMGLSSVPTWLRPFSCLSNGEQYRARLSYLVSSAKDGDVILIDEYTSVVDRDVAKAMSYALQKFIRKENKKIILASCHYDILEWLMPDWTCSPQKKGAIERCDYRRQSRPKITLQVDRVASDIWNLFKKHHYLTEDINKSFMFILFSIGIQPIAIAVIGRQIGKGVGKAYRGSRIVVLPDFQGLGIGSCISDFVAGICKNKEYKYFTKTIHPALGEWRNKNIEKWNPTPYNGKVRNNNNNHSGVYKTIQVRKSYCHEYIGESINGYEELLLPIGEMNRKHILTLF
jgi:ABC-type ATPase involved in cell division